MLDGTDDCIRMVLVWEETGVPGRNPPDLVTTWPSHMPTPDFGSESQRWEAIALTLRQPDSLCCINMKKSVFVEKCIS